MMFTSATLLALSAVGGAVTQTVMGVQSANREKEEARKARNVSAAQKSKLVAQQDAEDRRVEYKKRTNMMDDEMQARISSTKAGLIGQPLGSQTILGQTVTSK